MTGVQTCALPIFSPNSRNCEALESYEHESPETQQYTMIIVCRKSEMHMKQAKSDQAKMMLRSKSWLDQTSNHYKVVITVLIHTWNEHLNIQVNKNNASYLYAQHSTNA